jgi:hypothetical protein
MTMKPGDVLTTTRPIRSQKTGLVLPRQGIFLGTIENLGRQLILVDFGSVSSEDLFPNEIMAQTANINESLAAALSNQ